jgi:hypothetical protein
MQAFPEADRAIWFEPHEAARNIIKGQAPIVAPRWCGWVGQARLPSPTEAESILKSNEIWTHGRERSVDCPPKTGPVKGHLEGESA